MDKRTDPKLEMTAEDQPVKAAKIVGWPVWKLAGVTAKNVEAVKETEFWVHYTKFGYAGWGIVAPDEQRQAVLAGLAVHGITAEPWSHLPSQRIRAVFFAFLFCLFLASLLPNYRLIFMIAFVMWGAWCASLSPASRIKCGKKINDRHPETHPDDDRRHWAPGYTGIKGVGHPDFHSSHPPD